MKVELLVSEWCPSCHQAEQIWRQVARERVIEFAVLDMAQPEGKALVSRLRLKTIPAVVVDGVLKGVGVQSLAAARALVAASPLKLQATSIEHAGLSLSRDNRWFILSALVYLAIAGSGLVIDRSLLGDGPTRPVAMHFFALGFMALLIYGLGAHMLPRFTGNPIRQGVWPWLQLFAAHVGVLGYAAGFWLGRPSVAAAGGTLAWLALVIFVVRVWPVLWPRPMSAGP